MEKSGQNRADIYEAALEEVTARLRRHATKVKSPMGCDFRRMTVPVPIVRKELKTDYAFVRGSRSSVVSIWDYIWKNSEWYEVMHQALYFYQDKDLNRSEFGRIKTWLRRCQCWEHSDDLSKIYARVVEQNPDWILPMLKKCNVSSSLWKRRQSVVGLIEYASKRKKVLPFEVLIAFVDNLLEDNESYVQKGVGWTLREIYNVYPAQTLKYITDNILLIPPNGYSAATEKFDKATKAKLKELRKPRRR